MTRRLAPRAVRPSAAVAVPLLIACSLVLVGCASSSPTPSASAPSRTPAAESASPIAELTPVPGGSTAPTPAGPASPPTQTDTEWGRIWDAIPAAFPLPPDAVPTQTGEEGAVSGSFAVGASGPDVASFMESALTGAGFSIEAKGGPFEDDSYTIAAAGPDAACKVEVRVRPLSGTTNLVVRYGASCPFE